VNDLRFFNKNNLRDFVGRLIATHG